jgi:LmbE family N-acetylglucosaminyl deacetylase
MSAESSVWGIEPDAFGVGARRPTFSVDVRPWVARKLAALRCHRTQLGRLHPIACIDEDDARQWLGFEHFRAEVTGRGAAVLEQFGEPTRRAKRETASAVRSAGS